jgi:hypothetical protein
VPDALPTPGPELLEALLLVGVELALNPLQGLVDDIVRLDCHLAAQRSHLLKGRSDLRLDLGLLFVGQLDVLGQIRHQRLFPGPPSSENRAMKPGFQNP